MEQETPSPAPLVDNTFENVIDEAVIAEFCQIKGVTPAQRRFAELLKIGANATQAYRAAFPDQLEGVRLRVAASKLSRAKKIVGLLALLKGSDPDETRIGDRGEALKILWAMARGADKTSAQRAIETIERLERSHAERRAAEYVPPTPREALDQICGLHPIGPALALALARNAGLPYTPPANATLPTVESLRDLLAPMEWAAALARGEHRLTPVTVRPTPPPPARLRVAQPTPEPTEADRRREEFFTKQQTEIGSELVSAADKGQDAAIGSPMAAPRPVPVGSNTLGLSRDQAEHLARLRRSFT